MPGFFKNKTSAFAMNINIARAILVIFFIVGITGIILSETRDLFILLTPLALILSFIVMASFHKPLYLKRELLVFTTIFSVSFLFEAVGVNTGKIFGSYSYGESLGTKIFGTPLLIGLNWVMLTYCTAVIADKIKIPVILKITTASLLMVLYDGIMEQVAPVMKMWSFSAGVIPMANYIAWFVISFLFHSFLRFTDIKIINSIAGFIFALQLLFFISLSIFFRFLQ